MFYLYVDKIAQNSLYCDKIILKGPSLDLLDDVTKVLHTAFDCPHIIQFDEHRKQFRFKFIYNQHTVKHTKYISLPRKNRSKLSAKTEIKKRCKVKRINNDGDEFSYPLNIRFDCLNLNQIEDENYDFEITLTLQPGQYRLFMGNVFNGIPLILYVKDYKTMKDQYQTVYKDYLLERGILFKYLTHLKRETNKNLFKEWKESQCESGPMMQLKQMLSDMINAIMKY